MKNRFVVSAASALCLTLALGTMALAQTGVSSKLKDEVKQSQKAARVLQQIMGAPDKGIPKTVLDDAQCVAVFPDVIKAGFIVGGRGGRGLASCRTAQGWSAPAYFNLGGGSIGLQIGAQSTDFVLLFMTQDGKEFAVEQVHAGRRRLCGRRPGWAASGRFDRSGAQRADTLLLAQQGLVRRA